MESGSVQPANHCYILTLTCLLFLAAGYAQAETITIGKWTKITEVDRFTDRKETYFRLLAESLQPTSQIGQKELSLILFCPILSLDGKQHRFRQGLVSFDPEQQLYRPSFTYRFDHGPSGRLYDQYATTAIRLG